MRVSTCISSCPYKVSLIENGEKRGGRGEGGGGGGGLRRSAHLCACSRTKIETLNPNVLQNASITANHEKATHEELKQRP
jgi:hypothetical protein